MRRLILAGTSQQKQRHRWLAAWKVLRTQKEVCGVVCVCAQKEYISAVTQQAQAQGAPSLTLSPCHSQKVMNLTNYFLFQMIIKYNCVTSLLAVILLSDQLCLLFSSCSEGSHTSTSLSPVITCVTLILIYDQMITRLSARRVTKTSKVIKAAEVDANSNIAQLKLPRNSIKVCWRGCFVLNIIHIFSFQISKLAGQRASTQKRDVAFRAAVKVIRFK